MYDLSNAQVKINELMDVSWVKTTLFTFSEYRCYLKFTVTAQKVEIFMFFEESKGQICFLIQNWGF